MLDKIGFQGNLAGLFFSGVDWTDADHMRSCEYAFKNLALHYIEKTSPKILGLIQFDDVKVQMMLERFYRDAFGVSRFHQQLGKICPDKEMRCEILKEVYRLSIRIRTDKPRLTRIAAAFSLWMATFRPVCLKGKPDKEIIVWNLDASVNLFLTTSYLKQFGTVEIGIEGHDRQTRLNRIYYDFTVRDVNLSSLEMLYCSIFRPFPDHAKQ